jgi:hypothetical protein
MESLREFSIDCLGPRNYHIGAYVSGTVVGDDCCLFSLHEYLEVQCLAVFLVLC